MRQGRITVESELEARRRWGLSTVFFVGASVPGAPWLAEDACRLGLVGHSWTRRLPPTASSSSGPRSSRTPSPPPPCGAPDPASHHPVCARHRGTGRSASSAAIEGASSSCTVTENATVLVTHTGDCTGLPYGTRTNAVHIIPCTACTPDGGGAVGTGTVRTGVIAPGDPYQKTSRSSTRGMFSSLAAVTGTIACWSDPRSPTKVCSALQLT